MPCLAPSAIYGLPGLGCDNPACPDCWSRHKVLAVYEVQMKKHAALAAKGHTPVPQGLRKPPAKTAAQVEQDIATPVPAYDTVGLDDTFADLVRQRQKLHLKIAKLEQEKKDVTDTIAEFLDDVEGGKTSVDDYVVTKVPGVIRDTLDVQKLIENGVAAAVIAKSTVRTQGKAYVRVDVRGAKGR